MFDDDDEEEEEEEEEENGDYCTPLPYTRFDSPPSCHLKQTSLKEIFQKKLLPNRPDAGQHLITEVTEDQKEDRKTSRQKHYKTEEEEEEEAAAENKTQSESEPFKGEKIPLELFLRELARQQNC
ncbi:hypothetical protein C0Q70_10967 [Pomacea canaliculata]|uniref:Uncharacterized protein n=1 Tax=Pomacea canaliculata TaxID=400727 RepID=A0A2T7P4P2_POMCA|nr:hypothetical protein C0Q70_10967 [Pomacea canaliculata]